MEPLIKTTEVCGPDCACEKPIAHRAAKTVICLGVLAAVAVILVLKLSACSTGSAPAATEVKPAQVIQLVGEPLMALDDLVTIAAASDTVFVLIPAPGGTGVKPEVARSMDGAKSKLAAKGVSVGLFTLKADSPDHSSTTVPQSLPAVFVMCKDRGKEMVAGEITEARLLQAYVAASRAGGAGGCNCGKDPATCGGG